MLVMIAFVQLKNYQMKKIFFALSILFFALQGQGQKLAPVKWSYQAVKTGDKQYNIVLTANVESPWHIYSQFVKKDLFQRRFNLRKIHW